MKLTLVILLGLFALNDAYSYQYNQYKQSNSARPLSANYGSYQQQAPAIPQQQFIPPAPVNKPVLPPSLPPKQQFQQYQVPTVPPPTVPPPTQPPQIFQSEYQYQAPTVPPPTVPTPTLPPVTQPPQIFQSEYQYQAPTVPPPPAVQQQQYQQAPPSIPPPTLPTPIMPPAVPQQQQSSYGSLQAPAPLQSSSSNPCIGRNVEDKVADPSNPGQFFVCLHEGEVATVSCPQNLVFNPNTERCETSLRLPKGCAANPCLNGGICTDLPQFQFKCDCKPGFGGDLCEKTDGCQQNTCGPNGVCIPLAANSPLPKYCLCNGGSSYGTDCISTEVNPCLSNHDDLDTFPTRANAAIYVQCEGNIPHLRFCNYPLVYNHVAQGCDWTAQSPAPQVQQAPLQQAPLRAPMSRGGY